MNLLTERYPWKLVRIVKEIVERRNESDSMIESAINILNPKYNECLRLYEKHPRNKILKHNYHLLATIYDLLEVVKTKGEKEYEYFLI